MKHLSDLHQAVPIGDAGAALDFARQDLDAGMSPMDLVNGAIAPALRKAGELFEEGEYFVPELLMAARTTKGVFELLRPLLAQQGVEPVGKVLLGTVQRDLHDIGKNLVGALLEGGGFHVIYLGVSVTPEQFLSGAREHSVNIVGLSALLTTTLPAMKATIQALATDDMRKNLKVMVGGAPVTEAYAISIGADGYAENAAAAVTIARKLVAQ